MIYTLTLAPAVDLYVKIRNCNIGEVNRSESELALPGGKGINVSRTLNYLKRESVCLGFVGGYSGAFIESELKEAGIKSDFVHVDKPTRINVKISGAIKETAFNSPAPHITMKDMQELGKKIQKLKKGDILIMSGAVPTSVPTKMVDEILESLTKKGVLLVVDTTKTSLLKALKYKPLLVKPNKEELGEVFYTQIKSDNDAVHYARKLVKSGARNVLVSLADEGAILVNNEVVYRIYAPHKEVVNSVGSGDSMIAGFVDELLRSSNLKKALMRGVVCGSATAFHQDIANAKEIKEVEKLVKYR